MKHVVDRLGQARPGISVRSIRPLGEGDFCVAYLVNEHLVVRQAKHREGGRALKREECLLAGIAGDLPVTVPAPRVISAPDPDGTVWAVHELVPGKALTAQRWNGLPESSRESIARELGAFLAQLHSLNATAARECGLQAVDHRAKFQGLQEQMVRLPGGEAWDSVRTRLASALPRYRAGNLGWTGEPSLLNGDLSPEHVLFDEDSQRISGVIDWGDAMVGDPPRDFIFLYEDWGSEFLALALDGYGSNGDRRFLAQVYLHYLADQLEWTLRMAAQGRVEDRDHGVIGLSRGLEDLEALGVQELADRGTGKIER